MINSGFVHLIGSDAHNNKKRNFSLKEAYEKLKLLKYNELVVILEENSKKLLKGQELQTVVFKSNIKNDGFVKKIIKTFIKI